MSDTATFLHPQNIASSGGSPNPSYKDGRIKELSFPNYFIGKEEIVDFLNNFKVEEAENKQYVYYERFKRVKKVLKVLGTIALVLVALALLVNPVQG